MHAHAVVPPTNKTQHRTPVKSRGKELPSNSREGSFDKRKKKSLLKIQRNPKIHRGKHKEKRAMQAREKENINTQVEAFRSLVQILLNHIRVEEMSGP